MPRSKSVSDQKAQSDRFIATARDLEADQDEAAFKAKLAVIARQKPKDEQTNGKAASVKKRPPP